jgi:hypothetical protein
MIKAFTPSTSECECVDIMKYCPSSSLDIYFHFSKKLFCLIHRISKKRGVRVRKCVGESEREVKKRCELRSKGSGGNLLSLFWYIALYHSRKPASEREIFISSNLSVDFISPASLTHIHDMKNCYRSEKFIIFIFNFSPSL